MRIDVPWGTGTTPVEIEQSRIAGVLGANVERAADPAAVLRAALTKPGEEFEAFLASVPSPLLVVVNDGTRPTPSAAVLAELRPALERWLQVPGRELSFAVATGTHRVASPQERRPHLRGRPGQGARRAHLLARRQGQGQSCPLGADEAGHRSMGEPTAGRGPRRGAHKLGGAALLRRLHRRA